MTQVYFFVKLNKCFLVLVFNQHYANILMESLMVAFYKKMLQILVDL